MITALVGMLLLASDPAATAPAAAPAPAPATAPAAVPAKVKEKKICKIDEADSGSHMTRRLCLTAEEWQKRGKTMMDNSRSGFSGSANDH
jgi:predicted secreted protein